MFFLEYVLSETQDLFSAAPISTNGDLLSKRGPVLVSMVINRWRPSNLASLASSPKSLAYFNVNDVTKVVESYTSDSMSSKRASSAQFLVINARCSSVHPVLKAFL